MSGVRFRVNRRIVQKGKMVTPHSKLQLPSRIGLRDDFLGIPIFITLFLRLSYSAEVCTTMLGRRKIDASDQNSTDRRRPKYVGNNCRVCALPGTTRARKTALETFVYFLTTSTHHSCFLHPQFSPIKSSISHQ